MKNLSASYLAMFLFAINLLFGSCSKDQTSEIVPASKQATLVNIHGFLSFENQDAFESYLKRFQLNPNDPNILRDIQYFESQSTELLKLDSLTLTHLAQTGDLSGYDHIVKLVGESEDKSLQPMVDDPVLSRLISKEGLIQIGALVYQVNPTKIFQIKIADFEQNKANFLAEPQNVALAKVYQSQTSSALKPAKTSSTLNKVVSNSVTYENPGQGTCRFTAEVYLLDLGFYRKLAVRVKHEWRQRFWFSHYWGNSNAAMRMEGKIDFLEFYTPFSVQYAASTEDDHKIETVIDETFNYVPLNWQSNIGTAICRGRNGLYYTLNI
jgi:hypothetical protein